MFSLPRALRFVECPMLILRRGRRFLARQPVRVHFKGEKAPQDTVKQYEQLVKGKQKSKPQEEKPNPAAPADPDALLRNHINYKLLSAAGNYEKKLLENLKNPSYRKENQLFVVEGYRIIREALEYGVKPAALYFTRLKLVAALKAAPSKLQLKDIHGLNDLPLFKAPYKTLQTWSSVTTSPGIVGVFKIPTDIEPPSQSSTTTTTTPSLPLTLVLDELREPGNLGGVLRTAAAVGVSEVLLMKGCCDPWDSKVVRGGCGAHFRLRLSTKVTWDVLSNYIPENAQIFLADVHRAEDELDDDGEEIEPATVKEDKREARSDYDDEDNFYEVDEEGKRMKVDHRYNDPQHLEMYQHASIPSLRYDSLRLLRAEGGAVLILGGEVGISNAAKKFAMDNFGKKVSVPLANGMDSLNVGVASGVILYEMQKQLHDFATKMLVKERQEGEG